MKNTKQNASTDIKDVNDRFFHKIFDSPENARDFLKRTLPANIIRHLDLDHIEIENTKYVSNEFDKGFSDIVVKTSIKTQKAQKIPTDIYFVAEHKSTGRTAVILQMLKYMVFEVEKDYNNNQPPRIIIPVVFYHGADKWTVPLSFADQFDVDEEIKPYLLDYRYILFNTNDWDFRDENNKELRKNVFLFTAMVLMKAAYKNDLETITEIFRFWHENGFTENKEVILFFMRYISQTQKVDHDKLKKMLDENKMDGGEIMQTLAQEYIKIGEKRGEKRGEKIGKNEGIKIGERRGEEKTKRQTALNLLDMGIDIEKISKATGLEIEEIKKLSSSKTYH